MSEKHQAKHRHEDGFDPSTPRRTWHKSWVTWTVVVLMLAAMAVYILTLDNELTPGEGVQPREPAAVE